MMDLGWYVVLIVLNRKISSNTPTILVSKNVNSSL
jgi:hypothetical protein